MELPQGQDVIAADGWKCGPLPTAELEHIAWTLFRLDHADWQWDAVTSSVRDDYRHRVLVLMPKFAAADRWGVQDAHERLAGQLQRVIYGERRLGASIRQEILDYAESFIADAWGHFGRRLFYQNDVDANAVELANEDAAAAKAAH